MLVDMIPTKTLGLWWWCCGETLSLILPCPSQIANGIIVMECHVTKSDVVGGDEEIVNWPSPIYAWRPLGGAGICQKVWIAHAKENRTFYKVGAAMLKSQSISSSVKGEPFLCDCNHKWTKQETGLKLQIRHQSNEVIIRFTGRHRCTSIYNHSVRTDKKRIYKGNVY